MDTTEQRKLLSTCLIIGGTIITCGLGAIALRRIRRRPDQQERVRERSFPEYEVKPEQLQREQKQERHDGSTNNYSALSSWTQTFEEVMIEIPVASDVKRKDVKCVFNTKSLEVNVKACRLLNGPLHQAISPDECTWGLEGTGAQRVLTISLIKGQFQRGHWSQVMVDSNNDTNK